MAKTKGSPTKTPFLREMLEKYVFESEERFKSWVDENYTDAVRELGKLQPKQTQITGADGGAVKQDINIRLVRPND